MIVSQKLGRIKSQKEHFQKVHSIFFKAGWFFARSTHVGARQGARPPTTPGATVSGSRGSIIIIIIIIIIIYITLYNYKKSINVKQINDVTT